MTAPVQSAGSTSLTNFSFLTPWQVNLQCHRKSPPPQKSEKDLLSHAVIHNSFAKKLLLWSGKYSSKSVIQLLSSWGVSTCFYVPFCYPVGLELSDGLKLSRMFSSVGWLGLTTVAIRLFLTLTGAASGFFGKEMFRGFNDVLFIFKKIK